MKKLNENKIELQLQEDARIKEQLLAKQEEDDRIYAERLQEEEKLGEERRLKQDIADNSCVFCLEHHRVVKE